MKTVARFLVALGAFIAVGSSWAESVEELLKKGDVLDRRFQAAEALKVYQEAEKQEPNNAKVLTRMARQYRHLMADAGSKWEKLRLGGMALNYSQRAAAAGPNDSDAQLSVAITYGKIVPLQGSKEQVQASPKIKASVDRAIALNSNNDTAWHILGRWHRVLADVSPVKRALGSVVVGKLPTGSNEEALRALQKAVSINPRRPMHHIEMGRILAQMNRDGEARQALEKGLSLPNMDKDDAELKDVGRQVLAKLK
jgi:tetratricopeptide (TPR) repeat protein